ncbi:Centromere protein Cenp-O [Forsythia ovata]|uniref:Centromere protein Cenp-O n=1 Tax=Forsythia ovata TaxID=205694 RepID=A0ABD1R3C3_9LAMI
MQQLDQVKEIPFPMNMGEVNFVQAEDARLETTRARFSNVLKRHGALTERLSRDSDKMVFERLQREFEAARASQTQEICLDGEQWNDGLLATIRERVHMEAERKATQLSGDTTALPSLPFHEKITYRVGNKTICCLEGARIGIQYETSFAGEPCDLYHCVLESKSFLEKMTVLEHTVPFFLPIREAENDFLSSNAMKFIDHVGDLLQSYVDRREQVRLIKELYGNQIGELYHSLPYHMIEFVLDDFDSKVTLSLKYADLLSVVPTGVSVLAWPMHQSKKSTGAVTMNRKENGTLGSQPIPTRLSYAEDALRAMSLPEGWIAEPRKRDHLFPIQICGGSSLFKVSRTHSLGLSFSSKTTEIHLLNALRVTELSARFQFIRPNYNLVQSLALPMNVREIGAIKLAFQFN